MKRMNRRQMFLSTAKAALAAAFGGSWLSGKAKAQTQAANAAPPATAEGVIHGDPERATGTIIIDGKQLPPPPPKFGGVIKERAKDSTPWCRRASCRQTARRTCF